MLLVETHDIDDEILRQILGLGSLADLTSLDLESKTNAPAHLCSGRLAPLQETNETEAHSGALTETLETMSVRCLDAYPVQLKLVDTPRGTLRRAKKQCHPIICLDRRLHAGWSTVYSSSKSRVVVKFAVVPGKDKAELKRQLTNEKIAYKKLSRIAGWVIPRLYGEYEWHGGRALVLSDEGLSLSGTFPSLLLIERYGTPMVLRFEGGCAGLLHDRLILFSEVYCMHQLGVEHGDFEPRNVLRKKWSCFLKITDFGFSNVDHTCPGWRKCGELKDVWRSLQLDRVNFRFKTRAVAGLGYLALLLVIAFFPQLVHVTTGICIL
ncbi:hypothetical protein BC827DRAFT_969578 [Russula dissimulans]|nr:hypothetical protein BC827DRAFT_969578 [Russula dissimulans]